VLSERYADLVSKQNVKTRLICSSTDDHLNTAVPLQPYLRQQETAHDDGLKLAAERENASDLQFN